MSNPVSSSLLVFTSPNCPSRIPNAPPHHNRREFIRCRVAICPAGVPAGTAVGHYPCLRAPVPSCQVACHCCIRPLKASWVGLRLLMVSRLGLFSNQEDKSLLVSTYQCPPSAFNFHHRSVGLLPTSARPKWLALGQPGSAQASCSRSCIIRDWNFSFGMQEERALQGCRLHFNRRVSSEPHRESKQPDIS